MAEDRIVIRTSQISGEDWQKYRGKTVALVDGKVVAGGYTSVEVFRKARALFPDRPTEEIVLTYIPMEDILIL